MTLGAFPLPLVRQEAEGGQWGGRGHEGEETNWFCGWEPGPCKTLGGCAWGQAGEVAKAPLAGTETSGQFKGTVLYCRWEMGKEACLWSLTSPCLLSAYLFLWTWLKKGEVEKVRVSRRAKGLECLEISTLWDNEDRQPSEGDGDLARLQIGPHLYVPTLLRLASVS